MKVWNSVLSTLGDMSIKDETEEAPKKKRAKNKTELLAEENRQKILTLKNREFTKYDIAEFLGVGLGSAHRYICDLKKLGLLSVVKNPKPMIPAIYRVK